ncbi:hypothetical protein UlMin_005475 [Ulmus minor]
MLCQIHINNSRLLPLTHYCHYSITNFLTKPFLASLYNLKLLHPFSSQTTFFISPNLSSLNLLPLRSETKMKSGDSATIDVAEPSNVSKGSKGVVLVAPKEEKAGWKKGASIIDFVLRLGAIVAALAAAATMGTSDESLPFFTQFFQFEASYDSMPTFQYVIYTYIYTYTYTHTLLSNYLYAWHKLCRFFLIAMSLVAGYLVLSLPFSIVTIVRPHAVGPRVFLLIMDTVALTLTTAAASAAAGIVYLAHNGNSSSNWLAICNQFGDFCQQVSGAVVSAFMCVVVFIFLILLSAMALRRR